MGQQIHKVTKRTRRADYLKRKKEQAKLNCHKYAYPPGYSRCQGSKAGRQGSSRQKDRGQGSCQEG